MKITRENIDNVSAVIKVLIEKNDYDKTVADKLREYRLKASLPGFRPGKVPAGLIQKRFGKAILAEEINTLLSQNMTNFMRDEQLSILGDPLTNEELQKPLNFDTDNEFEFVFDIAFSPKVMVELDKSKEFDYYRIKIDEQMIGENIEEIRMRFGENKDTTEVAEKSSVKGDFQQVDEHGNSLENGISANDVLVLVDVMKDTTVKNEVIGLKIGDTITFDPIKVFEDRHEVGHMLNISHEEAENITGDFKFTIKNISIYEKAEVNQDLFRKAFGEDTEISTEEAFKSKLSDEIALTLSQSSKQKFALDTRNALLDNIDIELPETFLKRWLKEANKEMTSEQIETDFPNFTKDLRWQLIKNTIIRDNEIKVTQEETFDLAKQFALSQYQQYGIYQVADEHLESFANRILEKEEEKERLIKMIFENKIFDVVKDKVSIREKEVTSDEFREMIK